MDLARCARCGGDESDLVAERSFDVAGHSFTAELPARRCAACGQLSFRPDALERLELLAASKLAEAGENTGEAFRFMRRALGMPAAELAPLLGISADALARWDRADYVYKSAVELVGGLILGKLKGEHLSDPSAALDILLAYHAPRPLAKAVRLDWREGQQVG